MDSLKAMDHPSTSVVLKHRPQNSYKGYLRRDVLEGITSIYQGWDKFNKLGFHTCGDQH